MQRKAPQLTKNGRTLTLTWKTTFVAFNPVNQSNLLSKTIPWPCLIETHNKNKHLRANKGISVCCEQTCWSCTKQSVNKGSVAIIWIDQTTYIVNASVFNYSVYLFHSSCLFECHSDLQPCKTIYIRNNYFEQARLCLYLLYTYISHQCVAKAPSAGVR